MTGWEEPAPPPQITAHCWARCTLPATVTPAACCLVTGWSDLDVVMTAGLVRADLDSRPADSEWLFEVRPASEDGD